MAHDTLGGEGAQDAREGEGDSQSQSNVLVKSGVTPLRRLVRVDIQI